MSRARAVPALRPLRLLAAAAMVGVMAAAPSEAGAQIGAALELRPGGSIGQYDIARGGIDSSPRPAWRAGIAISPLQHVHVVASWGHSAFGCQGGFCTDGDVAFASSGAEVGVRYGAAGDRPGPWFQADLIGHRVRASWPAGDEESGRALGWGAAAGFHVPVARRLALSPALRVQTYNAALAPDPRPYRVSVASAELGVRLRLR
jgi:hypothetical protein